MNERSDPQVDSLRIPPHSIEAEQSVLGGLLLDNSAWDKIADFVNPEDFYRYDHRLIFQAVARLIEARRPADVVTVHDAVSVNHVMVDRVGFDVEMSAGEVGGLRCDIWSDRFNKARF
jgi:replicative DNA helicase